jgi:glycolate oxidase iron-sulfur subunit
VYLVRGALEGRIPFDEVVADEMYLCLGCRACETACPSGVRYGAMVEAMRAEVERRGLREGWPNRIERFALREIVPRPRRLRAALDLLALAQRTGLDRLAPRLVPGRLGRELRALAAQAPAVPPRGARRPLPRFTPAQGERRGRVALFVGCVMPEIFGAVNHATARVLARNGFDVVVPEAQGCCGALHAHAGDAEAARALARKNLAAFDPRDFDALALNSAGCGAALRELGDWLPGEGDALARRVRDVSEVLVDAGLRPPVPARSRTATPIRVCYDDPCHLVHAQRVSDAPRALLAAIPDLALVAHDDPGSCCGAAGIYNLTHREMSSAVLARKMAALAAAHPDVVASGNPGCLLQLRTGAARHGLRARIAHPVELLDEAYARE